MQTLMSTYGDLDNLLKQSKPLKNEKVFQQALTLEMKLVQAHEAPYMPMMDFAEEEISDADLEVRTTDTKAQQHWSHVNKTLEEVSKNMLGSQLSIPALRIGGMPAYSIEQHGHRSGRP